MKLYSTNKYSLFFLTILILQGCAAKEPLRHEHESILQKGLKRIVAKLDLGDAVKSKNIGVAIADITLIKYPDFAGINEEQMMYAASLPKLAILLGLFKRFESGSIAWDEPTIGLAQEMMRVSSNSAATELYNLVGPEYIHNLLLKYGLYDIRYGGGLWMGKEYGKGKAWRRDPLHGLSHGASASAAREFFFLLESGKLLLPQWSERMREMLSKSELDQKFLRGYRKCCPHTKVLRKSGSWRTFHSDSALVYSGNRRYIVAAIINDPNGERWLEGLPAHLDRLIHETSAERDALTLLESIPP